MNIDTNNDDTFTWRIENFLSHSRVNDEILTSPTFYVNSLSGRTWYLGLLFPEDNHEEFKKYIALCVEQITHANSDKECVVDYEISLMNLNSTILYTLKNENVIFGREYYMFGYKSFIKLDKVEEGMKICSEDTLIIRCRIKNKDVSNKIKTEKYYLKWPVKVFPSGIFSSTKHFFCLHNLLLEISLWLKNEEFSIHIRNVTKCILPSQPITGKVSLSDTKGNETLFATDTHNFYSESDTWIFPFSMTKKELEDKINEYVKDGTIMLLCEFSIHCERRFAVDSTNIVGLLSLSDDLRSLLTNKSDSDVKLRLPGKVELQSHRSVLTARSPVFAAMFNQKMLEQSTGIVYIENIDSKTLKLFLEFMYTGVVDSMDYEIATKLLMVADKYQVLTLKDMCASYLISAISIERVCEILILGDMVSHEKLKMMCMGFISINASQIFTSNEWLELTTRNAELSAQVAAYIGRNCAITPYIL